MRRIRLKVAYDGTHYKGWQAQGNGAGIEDQLNQALADLLQPSRKQLRKQLKEELPQDTDQSVLETMTSHRFEMILEEYRKNAPKVTGASRTDSGVHARGNIAVFDTDSRIPAEKFAAALNQRLPEDIRILESDEVEADWHPRRQHGIKQYEYCIYHARVADPMRRLYSYFVPYRLDLEAMRRAAAVLIGEHDFRSFCNPDSQVLQHGGDAVRTIYSIEIAEEETGMLRIRIRGNGFLYHMIRIIAGTLLHVGMGILQPERMQQILEARDRCQAGPTAPACGLTLIGISYEKML